MLNETKLLLLSILFLCCTHYEGFSQSPGTGTLSLSTRSFSETDVITTFYRCDDTIWVGTTNGVFAADTNGNIVSQYSTFNGLAGNNVSAIIRDKNSSLWFGHQGDSKYGISVLNGDKWNYFSTGNGLSSNNINSLLIDPDGDIWAATDKGVSVYNHEGWINYSAGDGLYSNLAHKVVADDEGNIWVSHPDAISKFDGTQWINLIFPGDIYDIDFHEHKLWILADKLYYLAINNFRDTLDIPRLAHKMYYNPGSGILLSTKNGAYKLGSQGWNTLTDPGWNCTDIIIDQADNLWIALNGVLKILKDENWITKTIHLVQNSLTNIEIDDKGNKWLASFGGISRYNDTVWMNYGYTDYENLVGCECVKSDMKGNIWVGSAKGLSEFDGNEWKHYDLGYTSDLEIDRAGDLWACAGSTYHFKDTSYTKYTESDGLPYGGSTIIKADLEGNIYVGSGYGAAEFNGESWKEFTWDEGLHAFNIYSIEVDKYNRKWFGTDNGLFIYDG